MRSVEERTSLKVDRFIFASIFVVVAWVAVIAFWSAAPFTLTVDDSYYYFQIARHVARGDGLTFDGLQETTGFHPLWLAVLVPLGPLLDRSPELAVRLVLLGQLALVVTGVLRLGQTTSGQNARALASFAAFALVFNFTKVFVNGLESALEFAILGYALARAERTEKLRDMVSLGLACGLLTLSRLSALPAALVLMAVVLRRRRAPRFWWALAFAEVVVPTAAYSVGLFLRTGHALPVSAVIKYGGSVRLPGATAVALCLGIAVVVGALARAEWRRRELPIWALPLGAWVALQLACDVFLRGMIIPEIWYLVPHATLVVLVTCEVLRRRPWLPWLWRVMAALALLVWSMRIRPETYSFYVHARDVGVWLAQNTEPNRRIAGWDCGIEAFYSERRLANLDGLASSWTYKTQYLDKRRVREFLDVEGIDYVAQYVPEGTTPARFHGLDLTGWHVVYDVPFEFRGILVWFEGARRHRFIVLQRPIAVHP